MTGNLEAALASAANRGALHTMYRRLRRHGEEESMIRKAIETNTISQNLKFATRILRLHTEALGLLHLRKSTSFVNIPSRVKIYILRKKVYYQLLGERLKLGSWEAKKEVVTTIVFLLLCFLFYQMYAVCRVGLNMADEKYRLLSIPVMQTLEALEMAERRKEERKKEMEHDMKYERNMVKPKAV